MEKLLRMLARAALVIVGASMIGIGVWIGHGQSATTAGFQAGFEKLRLAIEEGIPTLSPGRVDTGLEGQLVHLQGRIQYTPVEDPLTGLTLPASGLRRTVLMYQWEEQSRPGSTRVGGGPEGLDFVYDKVWSETIIDSDNFQPGPIFGDSEEHVNPASMPYDNIEINTSDLRIGTWRLSEYYAWRMAEWQPVAEDVLSTGLPAGDWEVAGGHVQPAHQVLDIGAVRIRYEYLPVANDRYSVVGLVRGGTVDDDLFTDVIGPPMIAPGDVSPESLLDSTEMYAYEGELTKSWIVWVFIGLLCTMRILAMPFGFLDVYTKAPIKRRLAITTVATILITAAVAVSV